MSRNVTVKGGISLRQLRCVRSLLLTGSVSKSAAEIKVSPKTVYRWLCQAPFQVELEEASSQALRVLSSNLLGLSNRASEALEFVLSADTLTDAQVTMAHLKVRAAGLVLENSIRLRELYSLEPRLLELEKLCQQD